MKVNQLQNVACCVAAVAASVTVPCSRFRHPRDPANIHRQWSRYVQETTRRRGHQARFILFGQETIDSDHDASSGTDPDRCPGSTRPSAELEERAFCPWHYHTNTDIARYPAVLSEARCSCSYGVGLGIQSPCRPIHYNVRVLKRTGRCDLRGRYVYALDWETISAGCTTTHI